MTACEKLVDDLVAFASDPEPLARFRAGLALLQQVRSDLRAGTNARALPVDGFRPEHVAPPQRGEAIRHIQFHAGCVLLGPPGRLVSAVFHTIDRREARRGRRESEIECRNNLAGRAAGDLMLEAITGKWPQSALREALSSLLCALRPS